jgi:hypothetical protein
LTGARLKTYTADPMKRTKLSRRSPIKRVNKARKKRRAVKYWGPEGYVEYVKGLRCCACHSPRGVECAHEPSRAAGGAWTDIVPLCDGCHRTRPGAIHQIGRAEFEKRNRLDLEAVKEKTLAGWATPVL